MPAGLSADKLEIMYYTYVLLLNNNGSNNKFYIGATNDLKERILRHKSKGVKTTKKFNKIDLVYYEACRNKTDALKREMQLKTGFGRGYIKKRLENDISFNSRD